MSLWTRVRPHALALMGLLVISLIVGNSAALARSGTWRVALIEVTYSDTTPAYTPAQLTAAAAEMNSYFDKLSYGKLNLVVVPVQVNLSATRGTYWLPSGGPIVGAPVPLIDIVAEQAGASGFDFTDINGISVLNTFCGGDYTNAQVSIAQPHVNGSFGQSYDFECVGPSPGPSGVLWGGWAHEFGHQLEFSDNGNSVPNWGLGGHPSQYASGYDQMDSCYPCAAGAYSLLGPPVMNGTEAVFSGWLPTQNVVTVNAPSPGTTVVLTPLEQNFLNNQATQAIKIPVSSGVYYLVEARQRLLSDALQNDGVHSQGIYDTGVHITEVNETANPPVTPINSCDTVLHNGKGCVYGNSDPRFATDCQGTNRPAYCWPYDLWHVGETYTDQANSIEIKTASAVGDGFAVTVTRGVPPGHPNMFIVPWLSPPMNTYETVDIWVDSSCNGYFSDVGAVGLRYGVRADGTVIGNGDDPCANHENRIFARVTNIGDATASGAVVHFQVSNPLGVGVSGSWTEVGKITVPLLLAGESTIVYVPWTPAVALTAAEIASGRFKYHTCIQVIIDPVNGELITSDNQAQENFNNFDAVKIVQGRYGPINGELIVNSSALPKHGTLAPEPQAVWLNVTSELPKGWTYDVNGGKNAFMLGGNTPAVTVPVQIKVPEGTRVGESFTLAARATYLATMTNTAIPSNSAQKPTHQGIAAAGGVTLGVQTVLPAGLSLAVSLDTKGNIAAAGTIEVAKTGVGLRSPVAGAVVAVDYEDVFGKTYTRLAVVNSEGKFTCQLAPWVGKDTTWKVRALWQGDREYTSAISPQDSIVVRKANTSIVGSPHTEHCQ